VVVIVLDFKGIDPIIIQQKIFISNDLIKDALDLIIQMAFNEMSVPFAIIGTAICQFDYLIYHETLGS
jgi:hypothetical protein